jgi:hypothetical protein
MDSQVLTAAKDYNTRKKNSKRYSVESVHAYLHTSSILRG